LHGINTRLEGGGRRAAVLHMQHTLVGHSKMMTLLTATATVEVKPTKTSATRADLWQRGQII